MKMSKKEIRAIDDEVEQLMSSMPTAPPVEYRKSKKSRVKETKKVDVSINSLLDILSVILVFLMKSYSTTSVQVKPSKELQVPFTHSVEMVEESIAITLTASHVILDDVPVATLVDGKVEARDLSQGGLMIEPLFQKLREEVDLQKKIAQINKKAEFKGVVSFIVDRHVPFPLLTQAMYTAGQCELSKFKFVLIKAERAT